jgi:NADH-quinone oxidoreductase subunit B
MEVDSAVRRGLLVADGEPAGPDDACVLVVAGTVTEALGPAVGRLLADLPTGTRVVSFGACAASGGPYWDAPTVLDGVDQLVSVDRYVPGCPPRPADLVAGLADLVASGPT